MKIVVCDDDALVYEQMKNIIASYSIVKNENLELTFYQTVEELLHAKHKYDILFLDIRFNNCDIGIDVAKKLRKAGNTSLIILLTSLHSKAIEGYEIGAYRYIVKPIIKEKMYAVLDEAISSIRSNYRVILVKDMYNTVVVKINLYFNHLGSHFVPGWFLFVEGQAKLRTMPNSRNYETVAMRRSIKI